MSDSIIQEMTNYANSQEWFFSNYDDIVKDYAETYIAIYDNEIVGFSRNIRELRDRVILKYSAEFSHIYFDYVYKSHPNFVL